jgi:hypothetical protein
VLLRASVRRGYARRPAASWDLCSGLRLLQLLGHVPSGAFLVRALEEVHEHLPCMRLSDHCAVAAALLAWGYAPPAAWASDFMAAASRVLGTGHEGLHGAQAGRGGASWAAPAGRTAGRVTAQRVGVILRFAAASAAAAGGPGAIWCGDAAAAAAWARAALSASSRAAAAEPSGAAAATTVALALVHLPGFAACGYITGSSSSSSASSSAQGKQLASIDIILPDRSLLIMWPPCQEEWRHEVRPILGSEASFQSHMDNCWLSCVAAVLPSHGRLDLLSCALCCVMLGQRKGFQVVLHPQAPLARQLMWHFTNQCRGLQASRAPDHCG